MNLDPIFVLTALLQENYFPSHSKDRDELPPIFSTRQLSEKIAREIAQDSQHQRKNGFDSVEYKLTRFNGVPRTISIPHPRAYSKLAILIQENWINLDYITENERSMIRPRFHTDGRIVSMDYDSSLDTSQRTMEMSFGCRFMARTDISNCYPSIYTHSIPWALVGIDQAKSTTRDKDLWYNKLDHHLRFTKRNETNGIVIGPATSSVISEVILTKVDASIPNSYRYTRFIDDYTCYCRTEEEAQNFIRILGQELARYKLALNIGKTKILPLPFQQSSEWTSTLLASMPSEDPLTGGQLVIFLKTAVELAKQSPDGSVLKFAIKALLRHDLEESAKKYLLTFILNLSFHQPTLIPYLDKLVKPDSNGENLWAKAVQSLGVENARHHRSDGMVWCAYLLIKNKVEISEEFANGIFCSQDSLAILMLYFARNEGFSIRVIKYVTALDPNDEFQLDRNWLLIYTLFCQGAIENPYKNEKTFDILKSNNVTFIV